MNVDDSYIAEYTLDEHSDRCDKIINEAFFDKHYSWFTVLIILVIVLKNF